MKRLLFVTATRAEFGLLKPLIEKFGLKKQEYEVFICATGAHLSQNLGDTIQEVKENFKEENIDTFPICLETTREGNLRGISEAILGFTQVFQKRNPDMIFLLGDRYELLAAAQVTLILGIPMAHLHGGEISEGAVDDCIRHSISKMASLHFVAHESFKKRLVKMGENPQRVHTVGALGIDNIKNLPLMSRGELEKSLDGFFLSEKTFLVTFHPVTIKKDAGLSDCEEMLQALKKINDRYLITYPNSDFGGDAIIEKLKVFKQEMGERVFLIPSLGRLRYLSALQYVSGVIGNSSSGLIEVPSFHIPTINILPRQKGRLYSESVLHTEPKREAIIETITQAKKMNFQQPNPYGDGNTSKRILNVLSKLVWVDLQQPKSFYEGE